MFAGVADYGVCLNADVEGQEKFAQMGLWWREGNLEWR